MKSFLFFLIFTFTTVTGIAQNKFELEFPEIILSDIETEVEIKSFSGDLPSHILVNGVDTPILNENGKITFTTVLKSSESFKIESVEHNQPTGSVIPLWLSILPPIIAILLALVFKEVIFSLFSGLFLGGAIMGVYAKGWIGIFTGFFSVIDTYIINALNDSGHLSVVVFSILIGGIVAVISRNGGMQGIVDRIVKYATNARSGQIATWGLGIAIFFDDYANTLVVGNTMRPITDKLKISREKLAYIVDSTAAPVAAIAFVTTWIGAELGYISNGLDKINANGVQIDEGVYSIFLNSLAYSFYPILTLTFMFYLIWRQKDFGPMLKAENRAKSGTVVNPEVNDADLTEIEDLEPVEGIKYRAINAVIPVAVIVFGTLIGLLFTGFESLEGQLLELSPNVKSLSWSETWSKMNQLEMPADTFTQKLGSLIGSADSYVALLWASLSALFVAVILTTAQGIMSLKDTIETAVSGFKTMVPAILILVLAWSLALITEDMHTADFLAQLIDGKIQPWLLPAFTFILAGFVAFSTGSSWSTMALVYPLILPAAWQICMNAGFESPEALSIFYNVVSAVLAGSVLGDHCSPISDTTILSSLASGCNHIDHVRTQIPYALTVGGVSVVCGTLFSALGLSPLLAFVLSIAILVAVVELVGKKTVA
ncbi:MAG: Na+/H+ antiporter NhaC family protein [Putridiphycobacter sp.]